MNKLSIIKASAIIYLAVIAVYAKAQDSAASRPSHTVARPTAARNTAGQPVISQPHKLVPAAHSPSGSTRPVAGTPQVGTATTRPAPTYRQPAPAAPATMADITDKSLSGQYQYLLTKVYGYQRPVIAAFYKNFSDSLAKQKSKVKQLSASLASQNKAVKDLQTDVNSKEETLNESNSKVDSISLLGIQMSKSSYNTLMWGLVILFGAVAAVVIIQSGSNRREAKYRTKLYDDLDNEYKTYKTKANEKEKKLARELQTVRNKLEEITGNPEY